MNRAEPSVRAGIAEVKSKLSRLHLQGHGVGSRWCEIYVGPGLGAKCAESQNFRSHQQKSCNDQTHGPAGEILDSLSGMATRESPNKKGQQELRGQKRNPRFCHRLRHLLVNGVTVRGNIRSHPPGVTNDRNRGSTAITTMVMATSFAIYPHVHLSTGYAER